MLERGGLYTFRCGVAHHLMKSNLASMRLSPTVVCVYVRLAITQFFRVISAAVGRCLQFTTVHRSEPRAYPAEFSPIRSLLLCSSLAMAPKASRQSRPVSPSLPDTRLEIRQRGFYIHSRHPLAKHRMIQFKPVLIHARQLDRVPAQPAPDNQICAATQLSTNHHITCCGTTYAPH